MPANAWFIYSLGSGWGHLNRALALARVVAVHRPVHLLTNSPYAERIASRVQNNHLTLHRLSLPTQSPTSLSNAKRAIQLKLEAFDYDCLIVDTFPRGLIGELADVLPHKQEICRVLVHRDLTPKYVSSKDLASFVREHYDGILVPGEPDVPFINFPQATLTAPWLSRNATDLVTVPLPRWHIPNRQPLIVVCATGQPNELDFFGQITHQLSVEFPDAAFKCLSATCPTTCSPALWLSHWPGMDVLQFAQGVVGGGGYNLVHECAALGVPLIAFALPRRYDQQARRIQQYGRLVTSVEEVIAAVHGLLRAKSAKRAKGEKKGCKAADKVGLDRVRFSYVNGVTAAIAQIEALVDSKNCSKQQAQ
ncbi:MAG: hypothetical protein AAF703_22245 [Cyanobacteria bacterium P01_D01_bin.105]